jgi:hypothetical protein
MHIVEVRRDGEDLAGPMTQMRIWLDGKSIAPTLFRMSIMPVGTIFYVEFRSAKEARTFARAFGGKVVSQPGDHPQAA